MPGKSTPVARGLANPLPASNVLPGAAEFAVMHRWPRLQRRDSHTAVEKFGAYHSGPAKNCGHRSEPDAACASFVGRAGVSTVSPKRTILRPASCRLAANARAAQ